MKRTGKGFITDKQIMVARPSEVWVEFSLPAVQTFLLGKCWVHVFLFCIAGSHLGVAKCGGLGQQNM